MRCWPGSIAARASCGALGPWIRGRVTSRRAPAEIIASACVRERTDTAPWLGHDRSHELGHHPSRTRTRFPRESGPEPGSRPVGEQPTAPCPPACLAAPSPPRGASPRDRPHGVRQHSDAGPLDRPAAAGRWRPEVRRCGGPRRARPTALQRPRLPPPRTPIQPQPGAGDRGQSRGRLGCGRSPARLGPCGAPRRRCGRIGVDAVHHRCWGPPGGPGPPGSADVPAATPRPTGSRPSAGHEAGNGPVGPGVPTPSAGGSAGESGPGSAGHKATHAGETVLPSRRPSGPPGFRPISAHPRPGSGLQRQDQDGPGRTSQSREVEDSARASSSDRISRLRVDPHRGACVCPVGRGPICHLPALPGSWRAWAVATRLDQSGCGTATLSRAERITS
jgi:hypothetical protein